MVTAAVVGRTLKGFKLVDEGTVVLDFGKHGELTIFANLAMDHEEQKTDSDLEVLERLNVGAIVGIDLR